MVPGWLDIMTVWLLDALYRGHHEGFWDEHVLGWNISPDGICLREKRVSGYNMFPKGLCSLEGKCFHKECISRRKIVPNWFSLPRGMRFPKEGIFGRNHTCMRVVRLSRRLT